MSGRRTVIIANGDLGDVCFYKDFLKADDFVICVNGGTKHALALGIKPDLVIGDLDSLQPGDMLLIEELGPGLIRHPAAKEKSDLELAVDRAVEMKPPEIVIIGALGGKRADHAFINLLLLSIPLLQGIAARIVDDRQEIRMINSGAEIKGRPGDYLSLFSLTDESCGIETKGLKFPLKRESLHFASTRGLSNELTAPQALITMESGCLLVIRYNKQYS